MVTMNSDKAAAKRKPEANNGGCTGVSNEEPVSIQPTTSTEESPNHLLYKKVWCLRHLNLLLYFQPSICHLTNLILGYTYSLFIKKILSSINFVHIRLYFM